MADPEIVGEEGCGRRPQAKRPKAASWVGRFFPILDLKMASFGALWYAGGGCIPNLPLDPPRERN